MHEYDVRQDGEISVNGFIRLENYCSLVNNNSSKTQTKFIYPVSTSIRGLHQKKLVLSSSGS